MTFMKILRAIHARAQKRPPIWPLVLAAVLYAISHRTFEDFLDLLPIVVFMVIAALVFFVARWFLFGFPKMSIHIFLLPLYLLAVMVPTTVIYYSIWVVLKDSYLWFQQQSPPRGMFVGLTAILIVAFGYALFLFRLHARFFFGLIEALTGLIIALWKVPAKADPILWSSDIYIAMLTAGVFLIVRGFDNMHTGLKSETGDVILKGLDNSEYGLYWKSIYKKRQS